MKYSVLVALLVVLVSFQVCPAENRDCKASDGAGLIDIVTGIITAPKDLIETIISPDSYKGGANMDCKVKYVPVDLNAKKPEPTKEQRLVKEPRESAGSPGPGESGPSGEPKIKKPKKKKRSWPVKRPCVPYYPTYYPYLYYR